MTNCTILKDGKPWKRLEVGPASSELTCVWENGTLEVIIDDWLVVFRDRALRGEYSIRLDVETPMKLEDLKLDLPKTANESADDFCPFCATIQDLRHMLSEIVVRVDAHYLVFADGIDVESLARLATRWQEEELLVGWGIVDWTVIGQSLVAGPYCPNV